MKANKNNTDYEQKNTNHIENLNKASRISKIRFQIHNLFSGEPKVTVKVDRKNNKVRIVLFDNHFKLMMTLALIFAICWGYCLFKAMFAGNLQKIISFGIISVLAFLFACIIARRAMDYQTSIFNYLTHLLENQEEATKLFNGMLSGSTNDISSVLQKINSQAVTDFKEKQKNDNPDSKSDE